MKNSFASAFAPPFAAGGLRSFYSFIAPLQLQAGGEGGR